MMDLKTLAPYCDHFTEMEYFYNRALEIASDLPENYPFLEIGTRKGGTALMFLNAIKESGKLHRHLFTVDPYGGMPYRTQLYKYEEQYRRQAMKLLSDFCFENTLNHTHFRLTSYVVDDQHDIGHYSSVVDEIPVAMNNRLFFQIEDF